MSVTLNERQKSIIDLITERLTTIPPVFNVSLIGSATRSFATLPGDIDLLVIIDTLNPLTDLAEILANSPQTTLGAANWIITEDVLRTELDGIWFSLAPLRPEAFNNRLNLILSGGAISPVYQTWTIGGYAAEGLCGDICDAVILFERQVWLTSYKERLSSYPEILRRSLVQFCYTDVCFKAGFADRALHASDNVMFECAFHAALFPLIRGIFALERVYFRGMKYLEQQLKVLLPIQYEAVTRLVAASPQTPQSRLEHLRNSSKVLQL